MRVIFDWQKLRWVIASFCIYSLVQLVACTDESVVAIDGAADRVSRDSSAGVDLTAEAGQDLQGQGQGQGLRVSDAYFMQPIAGRSVTAAYLTVANNGSKAQVLEAFDSTHAGKIELHSHVHSDGQMRMRKMERLIIEPGETVEFATAGYHLMLLDVSDSLQTAQVIRIVLHTAGGQSADFEVRVRHHVQRPSS